jgi:hypothetical protein
MTVVEGREEDMGFVVFCAATIHNGVLVAIASENLVALIARMWSHTWRLRPRLVAAIVSLATRALVGKNTPTIIPQVRVVTPPDYRFTAADPYSKSRRIAK